MAPAALLDLTSTVGRLLGDDVWSVFDVVSAALERLHQGQPVDDVLAWMNPLGARAATMIDPDGHGLGWALGSHLGAQRPEQALVLLDALVARGLDVNHEKAPGLSMIEQVNALELDGPMTVRLLDHGANPRVSLAFDAGLLHRAVLADAAYIPALVQRGVPLNQVDQEGQTPLTFAVTEGRFTAFQALLAAGADPNEADATGSVPLIAAAMHGNLRMLTDLLAAGAAPDATGPMGETALMKAVGHAPLNMAQPMPRVPMVERLIAAGANVSAQTLSGDTVAALAAGGRTLDLDVLGLLAQAGADMEHRSKSGHSARSRLERRAEHGIGITPAQVAVLVDTAALRATFAALPSSPSDSCATPDPSARSRARL